MKELVSDKKTNQPGLSNPLHPDRLGQLMGKRRKTQEYWGTRGCHKHGDRPRAGLVDLVRGQQRGFLVLPTTTQQEGGEKLEQDFLLVLRGDLQLLAEAWRGQDKQSWTKLGQAKFKLDIRKTSCHHEGNQTPDPESL